MPSRVIAIPLFFIKKHLPKEQNYDFGDSKTLDDFHLFGVDFAKLIFGKDLYISHSGRFLRGPKSVKYLKNSSDLPTSFVKMLEKDCPKQISKAIDDIEEENYVKTEIEQNVQLAGSNQNEKNTEQPTSGYSKL